MARAKFDRYATPSQRNEFLDGFIQHAHRFDVAIPVNDRTDPKDNKFLALAAAAEAELIVASDPHLTSLHPWRGIPIVPPAAFLVGMR